MGSLLKSCSGTVLVLGPFESFDARSLSTNSLPHGIASGSDPSHMLGATFATLRIVVCRHRRRSRSCSLQKFANQLVTCDVLYCTGCFRRLVGHDLFVDWIRSSKVLLVFPCDTCSGDPFEEYC